jgi:hypothetical protein
VVRAIADQLRPLVVVWLLVTLPVVCHHETAVVILGAMVAGHGHQHAAAGAAGHQTAHATVGEPTEASLEQPASVPHPTAALEWGAARGPLEWSAAGGPAGKRVLPAGQDGFAFVGALAVPAADAPARAIGLSQPSGPASEHPPPPAPPPRPLA